MTEFAGPDLTGLAALALAHFVAGLALGKWFRFGALLPAFAVVLAESLVADFRLGLAPWYALFIAGIAVVQIGYAAAAHFRIVSQSERRPPGSARAPARD
jgi:hypothetical protein